MKNVACLFSDRSSERERRIPRSGDALKVKNVACLLSDRSRALAQAYVLKRQDDILFQKLQNEGRCSLFIDLKSLVMVFE